MKYISVKCEFGIFKIWPSPMVNTNTFQSWTDMKKSIDLKEILTFISIDNPLTLNRESKVMGGGSP